jgi:hypothetical protein
MRTVASVNAGYSTWRPGDGAGMGWGDALRRAASAYREQFTPANRLPRRGPFPYSTSGIVCIGARICASVVGSGP